MKFKLATEAQRTQRKAGEEISALFCLCVLCASVAESLSDLNRAVETRATKYAAKPRSDRSHRIREIRVGDGVV